MKQKNRVASLLGLAPILVQGTPTWISKRTRTLLLPGGLVALVLLLWHSPLSTWVSISSIVPYLGAFLGAIPAVVLVLFESPTTAPLIVVVFVSIQQLEDDVLTLRIQGHILQVPSILIFLSVIAGGEIAGLLGIVFAVPTVAVLWVLLDCFRVRLRTRS
jgi:predicted PurR-regulated permease PerM